jgi:type I restriction enzyme M protein
MDDKNQNRLRDQDIEKIVKAYQRFETEPKYAYRATFDEIKENDFNLNIPRYVDTFEEEEEVDILAVQKEIEQLEVELASTRQEMAKYLKELGYAS